MGECAGRLIKQSGRRPNKNTHKVRTRRGGGSVKSSAMTQTAKGASAELPSSRLDESVGRPAPMNNSTAAPPPPPPPATGGGGVKKAATRLFRRRRSHDNSEKSRLSQMKSADRPK